MPTLFAAIEANINTACRDHLANADAVIGGSTVSGIFRQSYAEDMRGLAGGAQLSFECVESDVPGIASGSAVQIGAENFTVVSPEPSGTGWITLILQRAA